MLQSVKRGRKVYLSEFLDGKKRGNGAVRVWEEYFDKPLRVKEETLKGYVSTDGAEPAF